LHLVVAYDRHSGKRAWSALDDDAAYSSPMRVTLADLDHIIVFTATRLVGLSLDGGRVLWEHPWATDSGINPSQPLVIDGASVRLDRLRDGRGDARVHARWRGCARVVAHEPDEEPVFELGLSRRLHLWTR